MEWSDDTQSDIVRLFRLFWPIKVFENFRGVFRILSNIYDGAFCEIT